MRASAWVCSLLLTASAAGAAPLPRAASANLCTDELLLLLAAPSQVASITHLSRDPLEAPWWRAARAYPANDGQLLSVARARPAVVLTQGGLASDRARIAARLRMRVVTLPYPASLADLAANVRRAGEALGRGAAAEEVVRRLAAAARAPAPAPRSVLFVSARGERHGDDGLGRAWLRLAGLTPAPATTASPAEQLLARPPRLLLVSDYRARQFSRGAAGLVLRAAARRRVPLLRTDGRHWTCMGPSMLAEVFRLRRAP